MTSHIRLLALPLLLALAAASPETCRPGAACDSDDEAALLQSTSVPSKDESQDPTELQAPIEQIVIKKAIVPEGIQHSKGYHQEDLQQLQVSAAAAPGAAASTAPATLVAAKAPMKQIVIKKAIVPEGIQHSKGQHQEDLQQLQVSAGDSITQGDSKLEKKEQDGDMEGARVISKSAGMAVVFTVIGLCCLGTCAAPFFPTFVTVISVVVNITITVWMYTSGTIQGLVSGEEMNPWAKAAAILILLQMIGASCYLQRMGDSGDSK